MQGHCMSSVKQACSNVTPVPGPCMLGERWVTLWCTRPPACECAGHKEATGCELPSAQPAQGARPDGPWTLGGRRTVHAAGGTEAQSLRLRPRELSQKQPATAFRSHVRMLICSHLTTYTEYRKNGNNKAVPLRLSFILSPLSHTQERTPTVGSREAAHTALNKAVCSQVFRKPHSTRPDARPLLMRGGVGREALCYSARNTVLRDVERNPTGGLEKRTCRH